MIADEAAARQWLASQDWCDAVAIERLERLMAMLRDENERQNLVSRGSLEAVWQRHIVDSAQLLTHVPRETLDLLAGGVSRGAWLDLGTGAGFPGLVIAALLPKADIRLVESRARRIEWLERAASSLDLVNVTVLGDHLEKIETFRAAVISARAFAPLGKLLSLSKRFSTPETLWLLPKGRSAAQELAEHESVRAMFHVEPSLTDPESGIIVGQYAAKRGKYARRRRRDDYDCSRKPEGRGG